MLTSFKSCSDPEPTKVSLNFLSVQFFKYKCRLMMAKNQPFSFMHIILLWSLEKNLTKLWSGNLGQVITAVMWAISGRLAITSQNVMFFTVMWCLPNWLFEHAPTWMAVRGIRDIHIKIHRWYPILGSVFFTWCFIVWPVVYKNISFTTKHSTKIKTFDL